MASGPTPGRSEAREGLQAELDGERAAAEHWRRIARQRATDYAELRQRPVVRAALGIERRLQPLRDPIASGMAGLRRRAERLALGLAARARRPGLPFQDLRAQLDRIPAPVPDGRRITLLAEVAPGRGLRSGIAAAKHVDMVAVTPATDMVATLRRAIDASEGDLVGFIAGSTEPVHCSWLAHLAAAVEGDVVAAFPLLVHPQRPPGEATPHDGRVRASGLDLEVDAAGAPFVRSIDAGGLPDPDGRVRVAAAGSAAALLVDRAAYVAVGGLRGDDLDVAVVELCARLRARGGQVAVVPAAVMVDGRPVRARRELRTPIDPHGAAWRAAVDRSGPALLRSARPLADHQLRFAVTVAAPLAKVAHRWGDWHLAEGLAAGLRRLGHETLVQTADRADDPAGRSCDVHVVLRGLQPIRRSLGQRHVLWIISHPESIEDDELDAADLVLVASERFAEHLTSRTSTPVEVLLQATDHHRFFPRGVAPEHRHDVTVVAKTRDVLRPAVADALAVGLRPSIYGGGWRGLVDPELVVADHVDNDQLPSVYSSAGVVLNDHWQTMQAWGFVSNRLFDVLACGTPVISDAVPGIEQLFDGAVLEYRDPAELRALVDQTLADPHGAREVAQRGRALVVAAHTLDHRAQELIAVIARYAKTAS